MTLTLDHVSLAVNGATIIRDVEITLERRRMNVLLGPTLAGKTTLMRLMAGLERPSEGRVLIDGADVTGVPVRKRSVAMVYQQFVNYPSLNVYENIASPLRVQRVAKAEIDKRVQDAAELLQLGRFLKRMPPELSGGQQQRVAVARALVKRADLVLLDEPLANLDYKLREELREELPPLFAETGSILVYATSEPVEALLLGGSTATVWQGRIAQFGPTPEVYRRPETLDSARVFSDPPLNEVEVEKRGDALQMPDGRQAPAAGPLASLADGAYTLGFRAEAARLWSGAAGSMSFPGKVTVTEVTGSESFVHVDVGFGNWVCLLPGVHDREPGTAVEVHVEARRVLAFDAAGSRVALRDMAHSA